MAPERIARVRAFSGQTKIFSHSTDGTSHGNNLLIDFFVPRGAVVSPLHPRYCTRIPGPERCVVWVNGLTSVAHLGLYPQTEPAPALVRLTHYVSGPRQIRWPPVKGWPRADTVLSKTTLTRFCNKEMGVAVRAAAVAGTKLAYLPQLLAVGSSAVAMLLVLAVLLVHGKWHVQSQRLVLSLAVGHILFALFDLYPPWCEWDNWTFSILSAIFQGSRFMIATLELVVIFYSALVLHRAAGLPRRAEVALHVACWSIGLVAAVAVGAACRQSGATGTDLDSFRRQLDLLTYVWLGAVVFTAAAGLWLRVYVRRLEQCDELKYDPDFDSLVTRHVRQQLAHLRKQLLRQVVRPISFFVIVYVVTAMGEVGLVIIRQRDVCDTDVCLTIQYLSNVLIDLRGYLTALVYFYTTPQEELSVSRIRAKLTRKHRGVRFVGLPAYQTYAADLEDPPAESDSRPESVSPACQEWERACEGAEPLLVSLVQQPAPSTNERTPLLYDEPHAYPE